MKYKALFLDIDGTTVGYKRLTPTPRVAEAVHRANTRLTVCMATGRILEHTLPIIRALEITGLCILDQGTQIYDPNKGVMVEELLLPPGVMEEVTRIFRRHGLLPYVFDGERNIADIRGARYAKAISVFTEDFSIEKEEAVMKDLSGIPNISVHRMVGRTKHQLLLEITHPLGTKQYGIEKVAQRMGIDTKEIIGIGDGYNDFPMLMACGLKIAMENAVPELKDIADVIAPSVDEDGVAAIIEKFILVGEVT